MELKMPSTPDTDGDGFSNTVEMAQGTDPLDPASIPNALPVVTWPTTELTIEENKTGGNRGDHIPSQ